VSCVEPPRKDAGVWRIVAPIKGGEARSNITVVIKNFGSDTLYGVDVACSFSNGTIVKRASEHCADTVLPGALTFYTFEYTVNLSAYGEDYKLTVFTQLNEDENASNDTLHSEYFYREDIALRGYRLWDNVGSSYGAVSFNTNNASEVTTENDYKDGGTGVIVAGAPTSSCIYAYTMERVGNSSLPKSFVKFDHNWNEIDKVSISDIPSDMAYDFSEKCMYGVKYDAVYMEPSLLEIDLNTGEMTEYPLQYTIACIALDPDGRMYGMSDNGFFCEIDKTTGQVTPISHSGLWRNAVFQSMTVDHNTGRIFWVSGETGTLFEIDPVTGVFTDFGTVGDYSEISCLFGSVPLSSDTENVEFSDSFNAHDLSVYPNPLLEGQMLTIDGVAKADRMVIYDFQGRLVRAAQGTGKALRVSGLPKGVYFVRAGDKAQRIVIR
jgi:hypothetical protein